MDYVEISNSMIVYLLCGITVAIAFVQAVLYIRMAKKMTVKANIPATVPKTALESVSFPQSDLHLVYLS